MDNERRNAPRIEKTLTAKYSQASQCPSCWDSTTIKNISKAGILLNTRKSFPKGETLKLLIKIPFDPFHWLEVEGKVIESIGNATRIKFASLSKEQEQLIRDYVEWLIKYNLPKRR
ncbi:PilZ domain-containing protein [bacterium]|nr:MAG: PilZ domain-containing protein [bacterium]